MYDIAIIGAGPAGSTLARLLGDRYRTLLVDRRRLHEPVVAGSLRKPCAGLLAPAAQAELARQGLGVPAGVTAGPQLFAVRARDLPARLEQLYQRFYINVDREAFDRWLVSLVPRDVETVFGWRMTALQRESDGSFLRFDTADGGSAGIRAKLVIGADGASSLVRRLAFPGAASPRNYVAIQAAFELGAAEPFYGAIFDDGLTDFYGWTVPKGGELLAGIALPAGAHTAERFNEYVRRLRASGFRLGTEVSRTSAAIFRPTNPLHLCPGADGVLLAGEAAGFISPSSAEGISYALASASSLAHALGGGIEGAPGRYRMAVVPLAVKVGLKSAKSSAIHTAVLRRAVIRTGLGSIAAASAAAKRPQLVVH